LALLLASFSVAPLSLMGLIARLFLWLITLKPPSPTATVNRTQPASTPVTEQHVDDDGQQVRDLINHSYDAWGHENWVEYIQFCYETDSAKHHHDNAS
jgi:hypothetical protein